jgi:hypothetical protein
MYSILSERSPDSDPCRVVDFGTSSDRVSFRSQRGADPAAAVSARIEASFSERFST